VQLEARRSWAKLAISIVATAFPTGSVRPARPKSPTVGTGAERHAGDIAWLAEDALLPPNEEWPSIELLLDSDHSKVLARDGSDWPHAPGLVTAIKDAPLSEDHFEANASTLVRRPARFARTAPPVCLKRQERRRAVRRTRHNVGRSDPVEEKFEGTRARS
jgi:hypothetical protein